MLAYTKNINSLKMTLVVVIALITNLSFAQYQDQSRFMDWSKAGADTSVKAQFEKTYDVTKYGIKNDGKTDISTLLRKLLNKAKPYSIIYFPEGQYALNSSKLS